LSVVVGYSCILFFAIRIFSLINIPFSPIELIVPYGILICSLDTSFADDQIYCLLSIYIILTTLLGISSIFYYGEGFVVTQTYFMEFKNQIGPLLGIATIISEVLFFNKKSSTMLEKLLLSIIFVLLFISIIMIRNRSSVVGIILIGIIMITMGYFGIFNNIISIIISSLTMNYD